MGKPALMLTVSTLAFLIGTVVSWIFDGWLGLSQALSPRRCLRLAPVACLFSLATLAQLQAMQLLSPVAVKVLIQLKLPFTMVLSTVLLRQRYTLFELQAMLVLFVGVILFTSVTAVSGGLGSAAASTSLPIGSTFIGVAFVLASVCFNVLGSLVAEKAFRDSPNVPVYATVSNLRFGEMVAAFAWLTLVPKAPLPLEALRQAPIQVYKGF